MAKSKREQIEALQNELRKDQVLVAKKLVERMASDGMAEDMKFLEDMRKDCVPGSQLDNQIMYMQQVVTATIQYLAQFIPQEEAWMQQQNAAEIATADKV